MQALLDVYCNENLWVAKPSNKSEFEFGGEQITVVPSRVKGSGWTIPSIYPSSVVSVSVSVYLHMIECMHI